MHFTILYCPERRVGLHGVRQVVVEVWWVAADADLDVASLDFAVEELGGNALGELDVHVHLLQRLVPLEHLLPVVHEGVALLGAQLLRHGWQPVGARAQSSRRVWKIPDSGSRERERDSA